MADKISKIAEKSSILYCTTKTFSSSQQFSTQETNDFSSEWRQVLVYNNKESFRMDGSG